MAVLEPIRTRREPEGTVLYAVLAEHLPEFLARVEANPDSPGLPRFVRRELRSFLDCGILSRGFCRVHCTACGKDDLVALSCKGRGFCPSCGSRRMADTAAYLVDEVLPDVPIRQWVLALPHRVRFLCATDPEVCRGVRAIFVRAISSFYLRRAARPERTRTGAVVFVQRFDSALRLNLHFHALWPDGVFTFPSWSEPAVFYPAEPPTDGEVAELTRALRHRILRWLRKHGHLSDDDDTPRDPDALQTLAGAAVQGRIPFGEAAGSWDPRVRAEPPPQARKKSALCASLDGFSLHGAVRVPRGWRERLEKLCRYAARPPVVHERMKMSRDGTKVVYALKRRFRDGSTHVLLEPLTLIARLAALIPRPRVNLTTYHGVFAPAASGRDLVVPGSSAQEEEHQAHGCERHGEGTSPGGQAGIARRPGRRRYSWAELMKRVFRVDVLRCPHCSGRRRVLAFVMEADVVARILTHLGLPATPPAIALSRAPPQGSMFE